MTLGLKNSYTRDHLNFQFLKNAMKKVKERDISKTNPLLLELFRRTYTLLAEKMLKEMDFVAKLRMRPRWRNFP